MVQQMSNFMAIQTLFLPDGVVWQHQVRVIDGAQVFVRPDGTRGASLPMPRQGNAPGSDWRDLPGMLATDLLLPIHYVGQRNESGQSIRVFTYAATAEDELCGMRIKTSIFRPTWKGTMPCHGEVWTDPDYNILRIALYRTPPRTTRLTDFISVVLYGWVRHDHVTARLVPVTMWLMALNADGTSIESTAKFSDYREFAATTKILTAQAE